MFKNYTSDQKSEDTYGIFVDVSGSTEARAIKIEKKIIDNILAVRNDAKIVEWSSTARVGRVLNNQWDNSNVEFGGTYPHCIFSTPETRKIYRDSSKLIIITDGAIDKTNVSKMSKYVEEFSDTKTLVVCLLINCDNVSVFAPYLSCPEFVCIDFNDVQGEFLCVRGTLSHKFTEGSKIKNISEIICDTYVYPDLAPNELIISSDYGGGTMSIETIDFEQLINIDPNSISYELALRLADIDWETILLRALSSNRVSLLREVVKKVKKSNIQGAVETKANDEKNRLLSCLPENPDQETVNRLQLAVINARQEAVDNKKRASKVSNVFADILQRIDGVDSVGYSSSVFLSARTSRSHEARAIDSEIDYTHVPQIKDSKTGLEGPAVFWLVNANKSQFCTLDRVINCPYSEYEEIKSFIHYGGENTIIDFAEDYKNKHEGLEYIPLNIKANKDHVKSKIAKLLTAGKLLHNGLGVLLNIVDTKNSNNLDDKKIEEHIIRQLLDTITTYPDFNVIGFSSVTLGRALETCNDSALSLMEFSQMCRLLRLMYVFRKGKTDRIHRVLKEGFVFTLMRLIHRKCLSSAYHKLEFGLVKEKLLGLLYPTLCGIPQVKGDARTVTVNDIGSLFTENNDIMKGMNQLQRLADALESHVSNIITSEFITQTIIRVLKLDEFTGGPDKTSLLVLSMPVMPNPSHNLSVEMVSKYKELVIDNYVPFAFNCGRFSSPSKLFVSGNKTFIENTKKPKHEMVNLIKENMNALMTEKYGSLVPNSESSHLNYHKVVADYITNNGRVETNESILHAVYKCVLALKKGRGAKGNIYNIDLGVIYKALLDLSMRPRLTRSVCSVDEKILYELSMHGIVPDDDGYVYIPEGAIKNTSLDTGPSKNKVIELNVLNKKYWDDSVMSMRPTDPMET